MFDNSRYLTKGINEEVPLNLQILLWSMIDSTLIEKDYLQVFNLKILNKNANLIEITHRYEVPSYTLLSKIITDAKNKQRGDIFGKLKLCSHNEELQALQRVLEVDETLPGRDRDW